jgi:hypothetical protein
LHTDRRIERPSSRLPSSVKEQAIPTSP